MKKFISILRGINVGGHKKIKMDALRQLFINLGYRNVKTYIQSGNVIFSSENTESGELEKIIAQEIIQTFGFEVPVLIFSAEELTDILENNPFGTDDAKDPSFIYITFLSENPNPDILKKIAGSTFRPDEFVNINRAVYLYCPGGYGNTKLTNTFFENKLKLTATTRNLNTATELFKLINQD
jgi:uncharacterized protein (DUF1697 family)